jgi:medium-chain acyl-[acyl-carrier-protein] hydrolase
MENSPAFQFERTFEVMSFQVEPGGKCRFAALADLLQEVAWQHADSRDFGQQLFAKNLAWVLNRMDIEVFKMPVWGDQIILKTAGRGIDKLFALREFLVCDAKGQVLAKAMSAWILLDLERKRPVPPEKALPVELFQPVKSGELMPKKIEVPGQMDFQKELIIQHDDLDMNQHVNNVSYIRWVENVSKALGFHFKSLKINYLKETFLGQRLKIYTYQQSETLILVGVLENQPVFLAELTRVSVAENIFVTQIKKKIDTDFHR